MSQNLSPDIETTQARLREGIGIARRMARDCGVLLQQIGEPAPAGRDRARAERGDIESA